MTEFEPEEFSVLLEYLHTGMCIIHPEILPSLLSIADHYEVESLATACLESIDDTIDIYNVSCLSFQVFSNSASFMLRCKVS